MLFPDRAFGFFDHLACFVAVQVRDITAERKKARDAIRVQKGALEIDLSARAKRRIAVFRNHPGNIMSQTPLLQLGQRVGQHHRRVLQLRAGTVTSSPNGYHSNEKNEKSRKRPVAL
jgi:hypothetical protein